MPVRAGVISRVARWFRREHDRLTPLVVAYFERRIVGRRKLDGRA